MHVDVERPGPGLHAGRVPGPRQARRPYASVGETSGRSACPPANAETAAGPFVEPARDADYSADERGNGRFTAAGPHGGDRDALIGGLAW